MITPQKETQNIVVCATPLESIGSVCRLPYKRAVSPVTAHTWLRLRKLQYFEFLSVV
jgi:hypothetical protein